MLRLFLLLALGAELTSASGWSYNRCGDNGPTTKVWKLPQCDGKQNSPIDICDTTPFPEPAPTLVYSENWMKKQDLVIRNNGHSIQVTLKDPPTQDMSSTADNGIVGLNHIVGRGTNSTPHKWVVEEMHMHFGRLGKLEEGSEHFLRSKPYPIELHFVHYNSIYGSKYGAATSGQPDAVLVVGLMLEVGETEAPILTTMAKAAPKARSRDQTLDSVVFGDLTKGKTDFFSYNGGLTTPGCNEIVTWVVLGKPSTITLETLNAFKMVSTHPDPIRKTQLFPIQLPPIGQDGNYRPLQARNGRTVYSSTGENPVCNTPPDPAACTEGYNPLGWRHFIETEDPAEILLVFFLVLAFGLILHLRLWTKSLGWAVLHTWGFAEENEAPKAAAEDEPRDWSP